MIRYRAAAAMASLIAAMAASAAASAQTISLTGSVVNLCVLTLTTPGLLAISAAGTDMSTAGGGGLAATMTVVATGTNPTVSFTAPTFSGPSAAGSTSELSFSSPGGANRAFASGSYSHAQSGLLDTITINGRARNTGGFLTGTYSITSTATCSQ